MAFIIAFVFTLLLLPLWHSYSIYTNYRSALKIGLPILITPIHPLNPLWVLTRRHLQPFLAALPFKLGAFAEYAYLGWTWKNKHAQHTLLGPAFTITSPGGNAIFIADAAAADELHTRRRDFDKNEASYAPFTIFGPNVATVNGEVWNRHRKITTPPFNERNSGLVWEESRRQANGMLKTWLEKVEITSTVEDTHLLALHVLTAAGFGMQYSFHSALKTPCPGHAMSYRDALRPILSNLLVTIVVESAKAPRWILPAKVAAIKDAITEFQAYMVEMVSRERLSHQAGESGGANLMTALVRASDNEGKKDGLSDEEIYGNLFIFNSAGHETTANVLSYSLALLACYPIWQEWLGEEIEALAVDAGYGVAFASLNRCLALMLETLRLYGPLNQIPRYTNENWQRLSIAGRVIDIPPRTDVVANNAALQCKPEYWGDDALVWRPDRWINEGNLLQPKEGAYMPWAHGPRICPGKKFSQVEFVAVISCLLKEHRVRPVLEEGEDQERASKSLLAVVEDSDMGITIHMNRPEELKVRWVKKTSTQ